MGSDPKNQNCGGVNRHFKPNLQKQSNRHIFKTMHRISIKFDRPMNRFRGWYYMWHIQDGFRFWAIILASINIFAPNFVQRWKIGSPRWPSAQKSGFRKFKIADGSHIGFRFWAIIRRRATFFAPKLVQWWASTTHGDLLLRIKLSKIQDNRRPPSWFAKNVIIIQSGLRYLLEILYDGWQRQWKAGSMYFIKTANII